MVLNARSPFILNEYEILSSFLFLKIKYLIVKQLGSVVFWRHEDKDKIMNSGATLLLHSHSVHPVSIYSMLDSLRINPYAHYNEVLNQGGHTC